MSRQILYVAAPLRPTEEEIATMVRSDGWILTDASAFAKAIRANLDRATRWLSWLRRSFPETTFIAPWIASVVSGADDTDPSQREAGMHDACAVIERCDGIVLCGPRVSEGMRREMEHGVAVSGHWADGACQFGVYDLTGNDPWLHHRVEDGSWRWTPGDTCTQPFAEWANCYTK